MSEQDGVVWEEPGPELRAMTIWATALAALLEHPNRWARVRTYGDKSTAWKAVNQFQTGRMRLPEGTAQKDWELVPRRSDNGGSHVYARYVGKKR